MSALRQSAATVFPDTAEIPGNVHGALEEMNVPCYAVDRHGIIRWINSAAHQLVGDIRGRQQSSVVVPEQARAAKESFLRKMMGTEQSTDATVVVVEPGGKRVQVQISAVPLREGGRIVGVFGVVTHRASEAAPNAHPHLTPRQNEVLHLLARGRSTAQIAEELHLSTDTVRNLGAWYEAFQVREGQKLYLPPRERVKIW